jgi:uncharacterized protein
MQHIELIPIFFCIALLYSSVGFGGGSSYLAALALYGLEMTTVRTTALLCNLIVVTGGTYFFWKNGHLDLKRTLPLVAVSVPLAIIGAKVPLRERTFFILLGSSLMLAAILLIAETLIRKNAEKNINSMAVLPLSGGIGLLSGMVGIGGGIFLNPILHFFRWAQPKTIAAAAGFFILINSLASLTTQAFSKITTSDWQLIGYLLVAVFLGGQIGSRIGTKWFSQIQVKRATALLIFWVGMEVVRRYW